MSQSLIVTLHTDICKLSLANKYSDLDVNGNVLLGIGLKELVRQIIVDTELRWVVFGCCGVVSKKLLMFGCSKFVINCCRSLYTVHNSSQNCS